jgi:hypothetical protein
VVVLVNEYDKPILDVIENIKEAQEVRKELKAFYSVLKGLDRYIHSYNIGITYLVIRFVLITGVSKFSKVSLFNGIMDIISYKIHFIIHLIFCYI